MPLFTPFKKRGIGTSYMQFRSVFAKAFFYSSLLVALSLIGVVWLNHALRMLEFIVSKDSTIYDFLLLSFFPIPLWLVVALPMSAFIGLSGSLAGFYQTAN